MRSRITNIGKIVTWSPRESRLIIILNQEILIEDGHIIEIAETVSDAEVEIDADGVLITPGFVDSHTHPIFYGNRSYEFEKRVSGKSYKDIASSGGGIISSINGVRNSSEDELFEYCLIHIYFFLNQFPLFHHR